MNLLFLLSTLWATCVGLNDKCTTTTGGHGKCVSLNECESLLALVRKQVKTSQELEQLKNSKCDSNATKLCCPLKCATPSGHSGKCVDINSCTYLAKMEDKQYVENSKCTGSDSDKVCCGSVPPSSYQNLNQICTAKQTAFPPDLSSNCCGYEDRAGNKIIGGTATAVDQYPWLTIIENHKNNKQYLLCGGALISGRYVLTAAHCTNSKVVELCGEPKVVRLGEYDTMNEGPDCVEIEANGTDCTEGVTKINVESYTLHPEYDLKKRKNDIALLRLEKMAPFTYFIRPVCLPSYDVTLNPPAPKNFRLYAAGWGSTESVYASSIKLHVDLPYVNLEKCQVPYTIRPFQAQLWERHICAGGEPGKDTCKGDSGGPLVYENGKFFEVIGLVSFGPANCSRHDMPSVYTKVYSYKDWIMNTITD